MIDDEVLRNQPILGAGTDAWLRALNEIRSRVSATELDDETRYGTTLEVDATPMLRHLLPDGWSASAEVTVCVTPPWPPRKHPDGLPVGAMIVDGTEFGLDEGGVYQDGFLIGLVTNDGGRPIYEWLHQPARWTWMPHLRGIGNWAIREGESDT